MSEEPPAALIGAAIARAHLDVDRLVSEGKWTGLDDQQLDARFERAAVQALRVPAFSERSRLVRAVVRRTVPRSLRPRLRYLARALDRMLRVVVAPGSRMKADR